MENYDKLVLIYCGAPSVEPLAFGSDTASGTHIDDYNNDEEGRCSDEDNASTHHAASNIIIIVLVIIVRITTPLMEIVHHLNEKILTTLYQS